MRHPKIMEEFLSFLREDEQSIYTAISSLLTELGYKPRKLKTQRCVIGFYHPSHSRQIAKMGIRLNGEVFFCLRFSACKQYSKRFEDVVARTKDAHEPMCQTCKLCKGEKHTYTHTDSAGHVVHHCGAYAYKIPAITRGDVEEIHALLQEQHEYFINNAGMHL